MITIRNASKAFGSRQLWTGLDATVDDGELVGLIGPSGSGKSTLLNCLGLLDSIDGGEILVDDVRIDNASPRRTRIFRRDMLGYLFQNYALIETATIKQNLDVVLRGRGGQRRGTDDAEALDQVGLSDREDEWVHTLSGGEQQRVALARLIVKEPAVILADEPTGALDAGNAEMVMDTLLAFARRGACVVVATHSPAVMDRTDRLIDVRDFAPLPETAPEPAPGLSTPPPTTGAFSAKPSTGP